MMSSENDTPDALNNSSSRNVGAPAVHSTTTNDDNSSASSTATPSTETATSRTEEDLNNRGLASGTNGSAIRAAVSSGDSNNSATTVEIPEIPIGDLKIRPKLRFEVVTARVIETAGKKHVVILLVEPPEFFVIKGPLIGFFFISELHSDDETSHRAGAPSCRHRAAVQRFLLRLRMHIAKLPSFNPR